jgi:hypothetical protein
MSRIRAGWLGALLVIATAGCHTEPQGVTAPLLGRARLAGAFDARVALLTAMQDPRLRVDVISQDGQFRFDLGEGRFTSQLVVPERTDVLRTGTAVIVGDRLVLTDDGSIGSRTIPFTFDAGVLRLTDPTFAFDFSNVGLALPAVLTAELVRR